MSGLIRHGFFTFLTLIFTAVVLALSYVSGGWKMAIYALSFWQYLVYALAFFWLRISLDAFKYDSMLLKTLSLGALAVVYFVTFPSPLSLIVTGAGFALNLSAVMALGADRTYYGYELGEIPAERVEGFPYSTIPHPMLVGNILAYGGMLLDDGLREEWLPLVVAHMILNALIIAMEAYESKSAERGVFWTWGVFTLSALLFLFAFKDMWQFALPVVIAGFAFAGFVFKRYTGGVSDEGAG